LTRFLELRKTGMRYRVQSSFPSAVPQLRADVLDAVERAHDLEALVGGSIEWVTGDQAGQCVGADGVAWDGELNDLTSGLLGVEPDGALLGSGGPTCRPVTGRATGSRTVLLRRGVESHQGGQQARSWP
jgi:hypothetical protein